MTKTYTKLAAAYTASRPPIPAFRPTPWFGPDDYQLGDDVDFESLKRLYEIARWDAHRDRLLAEMSWWRRLYHLIFTPYNRLPGVPNPNEKVDK